MFYPDVEIMHEISNMYSVYTDMMVDDEFYKNTEIIMKYSNGSNEAKDGIVDIVSNYKDSTRTINTITEVLSYAAIIDKGGNSVPFLFSVYNSPRTKEIIKMYNGNENIIYWIFHISYTTRDPEMVDRLLTILENKEIGKYVMTHRDVNLMKVIKDGIKYTDVYINGLNSLKKYRQ